MIRAAHDLRPRVTHPPRSGPPSRASVLGVLAVIVGLVLGATFWWWARRPAADVPPPGDLTSAQVGALTAQLVGNEVELARAGLRKKDYRAAIAQAERALRLDADNAEARQVITDAEAQLAASAAATGQGPAIRHVIAEYARRQHVKITIDSIQVEGAQATVRVSRQDTISGKPMRAVHQTFRLVQGGPGWIIQTIGQ